MINDHIFINNSFVEAAYTGDLKTVQTLLNEGVSPNATDDKGHPALMMAAAGGQTQVLKALLDHKALVNLPDKHGFTALHFAADSETARLLIEAHADFNACTNRQKATPLISAAMNGKSDVAQTLLAYNVMVNHQDESGNTALIYAAANTNQKTVDLLLKKQALPEIKNQSGETALMMAALYERNSIIDVLVQNGANLNAQDKNGNTSLMLACYWAEKEGTIRHLLDLGANVALQNKQGKKAVDFFARNGLKNGWGNTEVLYQRLTADKPVAITRNTVKSHQNNQRTR